MFKKILLVAVTLAIFGGAIGFKLYKQQAIRDYLASAGVPPVYLNAAVARRETWQPRLAAIGSLRARQGIEIRSEVEGVIRGIHFSSSETVAAGDLLVDLDDTVERAVLKSASVRLAQARRDFERDQKLFARQLLAEDDFEASRTQLEAAEALVEETQGVIDKKQIRAPFAGHVGIHQLTVGDYLDRGDEIVTLQALDNLYLDFTLPENRLNQVRPGQAVEFTVPTYVDRTFTARVSSVNVKVDATTRNVLVEAVVDNADLALLPGMFADLSVILDENLPVVTLPREAVAFSLFGETVYELQAVDGGWRVDSHRVHSGITQGDRVAVTGVEPGALVAADTQNKLVNGATVVISNLEQLDLEPVESP
jgi:membrane fusion protein (multidrug efflux system)